MTRLHRSDSLMARGWQPLLAVHKPSQVQSRVAMAVAALCNGSGAGAVWLTCLPWCLVSHAGALPRRHRLGSLLNTHLWGTHLWQPERPTGGCVVGLMAGTAGNTAVAARLASCRGWQVVGCLRGLAFVKTLVSADPLASVDNFAGCAELRLRTMPCFKMHLQTSVRPCCMPSLA